MNERAIDGNTPPIVKSFQPTHRGDAHLPIGVPDGCAALGLPQRERDLLLTGSALLHGIGLQTEAGLFQKHSYCEWTRKWVRAHRVRVHSAINCRQPAGRAFS